MQDKYSKSLKLRQIWMQKGYNNGQSSNKIRGLTPLRYYPHFMKCLEIPGMLARAVCASAIVIPLTAKPLKAVENSLVILGLAPEVDEIWAPLAASAGRRSPRAFSCSSVICFESATAEI